MFDESDKVTHRLRALWALHVTGGLEEKWLMRQLENPNQHLRVWAVRLLSEDKVPSPATLEKMATLAATDKSPRVRLALASALQRLPLEERWDIAAGLVADEENNEDQNLPLMIWYGIEPAVAADSKRALDLASKCKLSKVRQFIARRIASRPR